MASTSDIHDGADPMGLFKNFSLFRSLTQNEEEPLESFATRVTQQSLLIETFCEEDRILRAKNQILWGMKSTIIREEAIKNHWTLEELLSDRKDAVSEIKIEEDDLLDHEEETTEALLEDVKEDPIGYENEEQTIDKEKDPPPRRGEDGKFNCRDCDSKYLTEAALLEHCKREFQCKDCQTRLSCLKKFRQHTIEAHGKFYCNSCDSYLRSAYLLKKHRSEKHVRKKSSSLTCEYCQRDFPSRSPYRSHMESSCSECRICLPSRADAAKHMKDVHQRTLKNQCTVCDKVLCGSYALKIHLKTMHDPSSHVFQCDLCSRKFALERLLKNHVLRVHLKRRLFRCEKCFKGFNSPKALQRHIDGVHDKVVASICHICSKVFYHESGLKWHIERVHEGVKHHKCEACGSEFYNRSELQKHVNAIHEKTLDFKCEYCGRLFNRKSVMVQHVKSLHTLEKNYRCSICGKTYVSKYHLTRHVKEGHEHYTRDCDICHKPFAGYGTGNLKKHKRTVHGIK